MISEVPKWSPVKVGGSVEPRLDREVWRCLALLVQDLTHRVHSAGSPGLPSAVPHTGIHAPGSCLIHVASYKEAVMSCVCPVPQLLLHYSFLITKMSLYWRLFLKSCRYSTSLPWTLLREDPVI